MGENDGTANVEVEEEAVVGERKGVLRLKDMKIQEIVGGLQFYRDHFQDWA